MNMPDVSQLTQLGETLARWQMDDGPVHLHPGDLGWYSRLGAVETASAIRIWAEGGAPAAIGLLDGPQLLRLAIDPTRRDDVGLARRIADSINDPKGGVFGPGQATVEARGAGALTRILGQQGWQEDEPWVPLRLDLSAPIQPTRTLIETIDEDRGVPKAQCRRGPSIALRNYLFASSKDPFSLADGRIVRPLGILISSASPENILERILCHGCAMPGQRKVPPIEARQYLACPAECTTGLRTSSCFCES